MIRKRKRIELVEGEESLSARLALPAGRQPIFLRRHRRQWRRVGNDG